VHYGPYFRCGKFATLSMASRLGLFDQGPWLKYKGHLSNISENLCKLFILAATNKRSDMSDPPQ